MNKEIERKIVLLNKLIEKAKEINSESSSNPNFKSWKNLVERTFVKLFGEKSLEVKQLNSLDFSYRGIMFGGTDYTNSHRNAYKRSFDTLIQSIQNYIEEFNDELGDTVEITENIESQSDNVITKVFISHSSKDSSIVEEIIEVLESIGLNSTQIFCSSFNGYGIDYGDNFLERIKDELDNNVLVLFILSQNFYESPVCLCEMGATWMKTNSHIPILVPPMEFKDIKGVIPLTQGFVINDSLALSQFKGQIESVFNIENKLNISTWERKRDRIINRLNKELK
jgi:predicted component of type VI protein secretion system